MAEEKLQWWQRPQWIHLKDTVEAGRNGTIRDFTYQDGLPNTCGEVTSRRKGIDFNKDAIGQ